MLPCMHDLLQSAARKYSVDGCLLPKECQTDGSWVTLLYEQICKGIVDFKDDCCIQFANAYHTSLNIERAVFVTCRWRPSLISPPPSTSTTLSTFSALLLPTPTDEDTAAMLRGNVSSLSIPPWMLLFHFNVLEDLFCKSTFVFQNYYHAQLPIWVEHVGLQMFVHLIRSFYVSSTSNSSKNQRIQKFLLLQTVRRLVQPSPQQQHQHQQLVNACQRDASFVELWLTLELKVNTNDRNSFAQHIVLSPSKNNHQSFTTPNVFDATDDETNTTNNSTTRFANEMLYAFNEETILNLFEATNYITGMLHLLSRCTLLHQRVSVEEQNTTHQLEHHSININMLHIASRTVRTIEKNTSSSTSSEQMTCVFETVSRVVDVSTTVALLEELQATTKKNTASTEEGVDVKTYALPALRGILYGGGSSFALNVMECTDELFWKHLNSSVFSEIVKFDSLHKERIKVSKRLVSGLDKYLWSRKPIGGLPPQLRALRQCEVELAVDAEGERKGQDDVTVLLARMPLSVRNWFTSRKKDAAEDKAGNIGAGGDGTLPVWYEDEGGHWGTNVSLANGNKKGGKTQKKSHFLYCPTSGALVESGQMATVFECGHVVSSVKTVYGMCPLCPMCL